jgi:hypothetical protein
MNERDKILVNKVKPLWVDVHDIVQVLVHGMVMVLVSM